MLNVYYVDTIKIIKYLKVLQHVSDPSSGTLVQCLVKNYKNDSIVSVEMDKVGVMAAYSVCVCVCSSLYRKALGITEDPSSESLVQCLAKNYKYDSIVSVDMNKVGVMATYSDYN